MTVFVVNRELAGISMEDLGAAQQAAITTADRFREQGQDVRYLRSMFIPATGQCRCLFEASDPDVVTAVQVEASLPFEDVLEAFDLPAPQAG
jgi:hypothetical protein